MNELDSGAGATGQILVVSAALGSGVIALAQEAGGVSDEIAAAAAAGRPDPDALRAALVAAGIRCAAELGAGGVLAAVGEIVAASGVGAALRVDRLPVIPGAVSLIARHRPAEIDSTLADLDFVDFADQIIPAARDLLMAPEPGGGFVLAIDRDGLGPALGAMAAAGARPQAVGQLIAEPVGRVGVVSPVDRIGPTGGGSRTARREPPPGAPPAPPPGSPAGMPPGMGVPPGAPPGVPPPLAPGG